MSAVKIKDMDSTLAYVVYMIMGSYFAGMECVSKLKEKQLKVTYAEQKRDNQIKYEQRCINYIDTMVVDEIPEEDFADKVEVKIVTADDGITRVGFEGFNWNLVMWGEDTTKGVMFHHQFTEKPSE